METNKENLFGAFMRETFFPSLDYFSVLRLCNRHRKNVCLNKEKNI